jgi:Restriction endonuclease/HB1, ASXL, restriction endonuclease HTH domain
MALEQGWRVTAEFTPVYPSPAVKAAVMVLLSAGGGPMHYRAVAEQAIKRGLWNPHGNTPWHTLNADVRSDLERADALGVRSVFRRGEGGLLSLAPPDPQTVRSIDRREAVKAELLDRALELHPRAFEELSAELIRRMGYRDVQVTPYSGDGGVDVTAVFPCGPLAEQSFVFQVKRFRRSLGQRTVRELRGVLGEHDQGVLITTGTFLPSARRLAARWSRPVVLIDGDRLAELFIEHDLGVERVPTELLKVVGFPARPQRLRRVA